MTTRFYLGGWRIHALLDGRIRDLCASVSDPALDRIGPPDDEQLRQCRLCGGLYTRRRVHATVCPKLEIERRTP